MGVYRQALAVSCQNQKAWTDSATGNKAGLNGASPSTSVLQKIEWKFECRDRCPRTSFGNSLSEDTGLRVREGMNMNNMMKLAMLVVAFASVCCAQEGTVNVSSEGKQKWSPSEVNKVYRSACTAVQREFGNNPVLSPTNALVLGADKNAVNFEKKDDPAQALGPQPICGGRCDSGL